MTIQELLDYLLDKPPTDVVQCGIRLEDKVVSFDIESIEMATIDGEDVCFMELEITECC